MGRTFGALFKVEAIFLISAVVGEGDVAAQRRLVSSAAGMTSFMVLTECFTASTLIFIGYAALDYGVDASAPKILLASKKFGAYSVSIRTTREVLDTTPQNL